MAVCDRQTEATTTGHAASADLAQSASRKDAGP
jgi:hypothetical protein